MAASETCRTCRFGFVQECRRHAPLGDRNGRPIYPVIIHHWNHWCGDYERREDPDESGNGVEVGPRVEVDDGDS